jgi:hypothetical protein
MRADCTGHGKTPVAIAKYKNLFVSHKRWRTIREVAGVADFE